jgi:hypothetical protein
MVSFPVLDRNDHEPAEASLSRNPRSSRDAVQLQLICQREGAIVVQVLGCMALRACNVIRR